MELIDLKLIILVVEEISRTFNIDFCYTSDWKALTKVFEVNGWY